MTARRLLLVRHGETDYNREGRCQGHLDVPLNETGRAQARSIAARLATRDLVHCFSSDLERARSTAEMIVGQRDLTIELSPDLREAHLGVLQSHLYSDFGTILGEDAEYLTRPGVRSKPPGGESPLDLRRRARRFVSQLGETEKGLPPGEILLVGHGLLLRALLTVLLGLPTEAAFAFRFRNCALTVVDWRPGGRSQLVTFNDRAHLPR